MSLPRPSLLVPTLILAAWATATAAHPSDEPPAPQPPLAAAGVRVFVDPATGEITEPTPEQTRELMRAEATERATRRLAPPLSIFVLQRGGIGVRLDDRFLHAFSVRRGLDGKLVVDCAPAASESAAVTA